MENPVNLCFSGGSGKKVCFHYIAITFCLLRMWQSPSLSATASMTRPHEPGSDLQADIQEAGEYAGSTHLHMKFPMNS